MSETAIQNPNVKTKNPNKLLVYGSAILAAVGVAYGASKKIGEGNTFATNIPVPTEAQPHINYPVQAGDTESSIAANFGHANDLNYENMLNAQLPDTDKHNRTLRPGEVLRIPEKP